ncbi:MAG: DEAD/DEAH box helicase, partial [Burkholderiales bacterium]|nr:DEAD/DEAH box helicase [Burkholderiales bacterium]
MASKDLDIEARGERLVLLPERAVYWPKRHTLLVADAHFGKASLRADGTPSSRGTLNESLARLDAILARHPVKQIIFLGDFLHEEKGREPATFEKLQSWRERHPDLELMLVRGSRDTHTGDPPKSLRVQVVDECYPFDPFALCHEPAEAVRRFAIAGYLHPVFALRG